MAVEIERKFLVRMDVFQNVKSAAESSCVIRQGYLSTDPRRTVRVRIEAYDDRFISRASLTIKGMSTEDGLSRSEWEYPINADEAEEMIKLAVGVVKKQRLIIGRFEVDIFSDENEVQMPPIAEIELLHPDEDLGRLPEWIGEEVTGDPRYYNSNMIKKE